jgi:hypothetical protein
MSDTDARLWHPRLRINRVLRVMLHTRWSGDHWLQSLDLGLGLLSRFRDLGVTRLWGWLSVRARRTGLDSIEKLGEGRPPVLTQCLTSTSR